MSPLLKSKSGSIRRLLATGVLASVLLFSLSAGLPPPVADAQRKGRKTKTTAASVSSQRGVNTITSDQLRDYLSFIASDEMEGRDTPSRGLDTTAKFLGMNLSRWGLKPAGDNGTFFQKISLRKDVIDKTQTTAQFRDQVLTLGEDYIPLSRPVSTGPVSLVFAGNGWFIKSRNIDAYKGLDAKGKIAIVLEPPNGLPHGITNADLQGKRGEDWMNASEYARKQGVIGIIVIPDFQFIANWDRNRNRITERGMTAVEKFQSPTADQIPGIVASPRLANLLFQGEKQSAASLFESIYSQMAEPFALNPDKKISMTVTMKSDGGSTQNVVAVFEGSDPLLKAEYVALGAHYDHVGVGIPVNGDAIYNGADDDGSGTTALLAIAEALAKASSRPKRSVLFVWHAGEEKGLWGSKYFTSYPTVPLDKIVVQLNIDMIGRSKKEGDTNPRNSQLSGPNEIYVIGSKMMSTELGDMTEKVNKEYLNLVFDYRYDDPNDPNRFFFRSDHINYARKGIPIVFFFDGEHEDYHRPGDSADKIDYQKMEKVVRTVYMLLWEIANKPSRPTVDKHLPAQAAGN